MKRHLLLLGIAVALVGCERPVKVSEHRITVQVVDVKLSSKSNSKVILREVNTGYVWSPQRLSCSKEKARRVKIGSKWDVVEEVYRYKDGRGYNSLAGTPAICTKSQ